MARSPSPLRRLVESPFEFRESRLDVSGRTCSPTSASWSSEQAKSEEIPQYPSFSTINNGFFSRQKRKLSAGLPRFHTAPSRDRYNGEEKLGRDGRWRDNRGRRNRLLTSLATLLHRLPFRLLLAAVAVFIWYLTFRTGMSFTLVF
jgi:mannan polymerase II complex MNN10 subunit